MVEKRVYPNPKFRSAEEEQEYWEKHSPLTEGYKAELQTGPARRASFLSVRLDGRELELLRKRAAQQGVPPSTLARSLILRGLSAQEDAVALDERVRALEQKLREIEKQLPVPAAGT